jgi:hypothetical protein
MIADWRSLIAGGQVRRLVVPNQQSAINNQQPVTITKSGNQQ